MTIYIQSNQNTLKRHNCIISPKCQIIKFQIFDDVTAGIPHSYHVKCYQCHWGDIVNVGKPNERDDYKPMIHLCRYARRPTTGDCERVAGLRRQLLGEFEEHLRHLCRTIKVNIVSINVISKCSVLLALYDGGGFVFVKSNFKSNAKDDPKIVDHFEIK